MPERSGIYEIVNLKTNNRYVGQALNLRQRLRDHVRDLDANNEFTNQEGLLQHAWICSGRDAFIFRVLEFVNDNRRDTYYHVRPDNLSLAEHYHINQNKCGDYNKDKRIVAARFNQLIQRKAWLEPIDDETVGLIQSVKPKAFLVGKRGGYACAVIVLGFDEADVKTRAAAIDDNIKRLGVNLASLPLTEPAIQRWIQKGAKDLRSMQTGVLLPQCAPSD